MTNLNGWTYCDIQPCTARSRWPQRDGWTHCLHRDLCPTCGRPTATPRRRADWFEPALPGMKTEEPYRG